MYVCMYPSIYLSIHLSIYLSICKRENEAILRDFLNFWTWQHQKRSNSARLPQVLHLTTLKTKQFCETSSFFSPPARWGLLDFIRAVALLLLLRFVFLLRLLRLFLQFLLGHVCINFHLHFRLANSSPSSSPTSELSAHCWTSTWDLPSSVRTAGPQPGTFPAQCALLDLNLGPSQLSVHCWTSTWDLPSSVCTAGPQPGTFPAQCAPLDLNGQIEMPEDMPDRVPEDMPDRMLEDMPDRVPEDMPDRMLEDMPDRMPEGMPDRMPDKMSGRYAR